MSTRSYDIRRPHPVAPNGQFSGSPPYISVAYTNTSSNSLKVSGKLVLKPQPHLMIKDKVMSWSYTSAPDRAPSYNDFATVYNAATDRGDALPVGFDPSNTYNRVLSKWKGTLHRGGASLGITAAQWGQTSSMLLDRFDKMDRLLRRTEVRLNRNLRTRVGRRRFRRDRSLGKLPRRSVRRDPLASQVLEYEFGWAPLSQEIGSLTASLFQHAIPGEYVRVTHTDVFTKDTGLVQGGPYGKWRTDHYTVFRSTLAASVAIENPNLWLANRAGLVNLPGVVWDAIPWSFLVGFFVNVNQLLGSLSDEVGLTITDRSTTDTTVSILNVETHLNGVNAQNSYAISRSKLVWKKRHRIVGAFPSVSLQFRVPDLNPELLVIAAALVVQRMSNITKLLDATRLLKR